MSKRKDLTGAFNVITDRYAGGDKEVAINYIVAAILHQRDFAHDLVVEESVGDSVMKCTPVKDRNVDEGQSSGRDEAGSGGTIPTSDIGDADSQPLVDTLLVFDRFCNLKEGCCSYWNHDYCSKYLCATRLVERLDPCKKDYPNGLALVGRKG